MGMVPLYLPLFREKFVWNGKASGLLGKGQRASGKKREKKSTEKMISYSRELMDIHKGFANNTG